jgi:hypothetical protein
MLAQVGALKQGSNTRIDQRTSQKRSSILESMSSTGVSNRRGRLMAVQVSMSHCSGRTFSIDVVHHGTILNSVDLISAVTPIATSISTLIRITIHAHEVNCRFTAFPAHHRVAGFFFTGSSSKRTANKGMET